jgi:hypothetical protein
MIKVDTLSPDQTVTGDRYLLHGTAELAMGNHLTLLSHRQLLALQLQCRLRLNMAGGICPGNHPALLQPDTLIRSQRQLMSAGNNRFIGMN